MPKKSSGQQKVKELEFTPFHFKAIFGLKPQVYVPVIYTVILVLGLYFLFLDKGFRRPQVQLQFHMLSGDASLYVDGKFYSNLISSQDWRTSSVILPEGRRELRIEKAGMEPWEQQQDFHANLWNNRWKPKTYSFEIRMLQAQSVEAYHLWQESWRSYLYRGLEAQKERSFDASHPYPWVLSEGLRAVLYSQPQSGTYPTVIPPYWSADIQRGLASTTDIYQWGDLLSGYSLIAQVQRPHLSAVSLQDTAGKVGLLAPRSLAVLARSAVKRLERLEPRAKSLFHSWQKAMGEDSVQAPSLEEFWQERQSAVGEVTSSQSAIPAAQLGRPVALKLGELDFIRILGRGIAVQQTEVSNAEFAHFWFGEAGLRWRESQVEQNNPSQQGFAGMALYGADKAELPWGWSDSADLAAILSNPLLQDQPVRGITWDEAQAFAKWYDRQTANTQWQLHLPSAAQYQQLVFLEQALVESEQLGKAEVEGGKLRTESELDFRIPQGPPNFSQQPKDILGLKGLSGSLWEWQASDYLPFPVLASANGSSNLFYKALSGGSWLNILPITEGTRDLWTAEFFDNGNELPVGADYRTVAGQFAAIRSPYTGFRLVAQVRDSVTVQP